MEKFIFKRDKYHPCIDIKVAGKPYRIRLTNTLFRNYWSTINKQSNIGKEIEVKFQKRLLQHDMLYNPNQITINDTLIIPYNAGKYFGIWMVIAAVGVVILCCFLFYSTLITYKDEMLQLDKQLWRENKWKFVSVWLISD